MPKKIEELSELEFNTLKDSGLLRIIYPEAPLHWDKIPRKPILIENPDLSDLKKICQKYINDVESNDYCDDNDYQQYLYETVMKTFFGKEVFKYINSKI